MSLHFITDDAERWGTGQNRPMTAAELDDTVWTLKALIDTASANGPVSVEGVHLTGGTNLWLDLTDGSSIGPVILPVAQLTGRGAWESETVYLVNEVVSVGNSAYVVKYDHTSGLIFSEGATDGDGHIVYSKLITITETLPEGGDQGMVLVKASNSTGDFVWAFQVGLMTPGGVAGQVPVKVSSDYADVEWSSAIALPAYDPVDASGDVVIDYANGQCQRLVVIGDITSLTVNNFGVEGREFKMTLEVWAGDAYSVEWPSGWFWDEGTLPTLGEKALIVLVTLDGGTTIYANVVGQNYKLAGA